MDIGQFIILVSGAIAIWLTQQPNTGWQRYACLVGIVGQPFWLYSTWEAQQFGMFGLSVFYTYSWLLGIKVHWLDARRSQAN